MKIENTYPGAQRGCLITAPRGKARSGSVDHVKALLTTGALAAILWLWVTLAGPEDPSGEATGGTPEPLASSPVLMQWDPLPTLVPTPQGGLVRTAPPPSVKRKGASPPPAGSGLRVVQSLPPPRVIQVPVPSNQRPAAVTRSSR